MHGNSQQDDLKCVRRCLEGDVEAFGELVERYQVTVFNAVYRMVRHYEDAREITQAVFLKAFRNLESFDLDRRFFSWLYRIAMNESINFNAARRPAEEIPETLPSPGRSPEDLLEASEIERHVGSALLTLTPDYRAVVVLRHFMDCSYLEAAEILQIPEKTVRSRLFSARRVLREALAEYGYDGRSLTHE